MAKSVHILLSAFLSVLVFWGGSGVNAYFFCCDDCRINKVSVITGNNCCDTSTAENNKGCSHHINHIADKCCGVDRIEFAWHSDSNNQIDLQPMSFDLNNSIFLLAHEVKLVTEPLLSSLLLNRQTQSPPDLSKNDYFDWLCTLII